MNSTFLIIIFFLLASCVNHSSDEYIDNVVKKILLEDSITLLLSQLDNKSLVQSVINSEFNNSSFSPVVGNNFLIPVSAVYSDSVEGSIDIKGLRYPLVIGQNILPWTHSTKLSIQLSGKTLRFAGLGINAKEASWNDYGVRDVKNDVVIIQAGDPGHYDPKITAFNGEYQGYYSRWQYKVEEAKDAVLPVFF